MPMPATAHVPTSSVQAPVLSLPSHSYLSPWNALTLGRQVLLQRGESLLTAVDHHDPHSHSHSPAEAATTFTRHAAQQQHCKYTGECDALLLMCMFAVEQSVGSVGSVGSVAAAAGSSSASSAASSASSAAAQLALLDEFIFSVLTVPMLTLLLSAQCLASLCRWRLFHPLLLGLTDPSYLELGVAVCGSSSPSLSASASMCLRVIRSGQWLLGNVSALAPFLHIHQPPHPSSSPSSSPSSPSPSAATDAATATTLYGTHKASSSSSSSSSFSSAAQWITYSSAASEEVSQEVLLTYLSVCHAWAEFFSVNDVLQGRRGIIWHRAGSTNSVAVAVPLGLEAQLLTLLHGEVLTDLAERILRPIRTPLDLGAGADGAEGIADEWLRAFAARKDVDDIAAALSSSSYAVTHATLADHQEASKWFTSKWAKKVASSVGSSLGLSSFFASSSKPVGGTTTTTSTTTAAAASSSSSPAPGAGPASPSSPVGKLLAPEEDPQLVVALCRLWSTLLPNASSSPPDSLPWRSISQLAFAGSLVPRLWCFLLRRERFELDKCVASLVVAQPASGPLLQPLFANDSLPVLLALAPILRRSLIAAEDAELYDLGVGTT
jgi:hypothetical protein